MYFHQKIFEKYPNIKYHENPSNGSRVDPCGWTYGQLDMMKLKVAFRSFAKTAKTCRYLIAIKETMCSKFNLTETLDTGSDI